MSNASVAALALAVGAGAGAAVYHFTRDGRKKPTPSGAPASSLSAAPTTPTNSATTAAPPRKSSPCSLKLDKDTLTLEGERVDIATAVARCKVAGRAELAVSPNAPLAVNRELYAALLAAGVPTAVKTP